MVNVMTIPRNHNLDDIDGREARYLTWLVGMLLPPPVNKAQFRQELESLASAAEALNSDEARFDREDDGAALALWRTHPSDVREETREGRAKACSLGLHHVSCCQTNPVNTAELARAVEEIGRAAAALREDKPSSIAVVKDNASLGSGPVRVWLRIAGLWFFIAAATLGLAIALIVSMR
jgi:hypothetical protein